MKCALADYARAFAASLITAFLVLNKPLLDLSVDDWKAVLSAAVASFLPVVLVALDPKNGRYGLGHAE
jgi:hypothetical protein